MVQFLSLTSSALILLVACASASKSKSGVDLLTWDAAYVKANKLVSQMSLKQKVDVSTGVGWGVGACVGNTYPVTNPDFPALCLQDAPLGVRGVANTTSGVSGINAAASFDKKAIRERGEYMGKEFRGKGVHVQLGPAMNMMRNPKGGRGWESFGEDPFLSGVAASETILGIQSQGVTATAKHYIANDQEVNRNYASSNLDDRTLHEVYLWPFARSVEAGVGSVMCSYNKVNEVYACENDVTLNKVLKEELGFRGFVQSDWAGTHSTESTVKGLDMTMPGDITFNSNDSYFGKNLTDAVEAGTVSEERVTDMTLRIVATWYKHRQDENYPEVSFDYFRPELTKFVDVQEDHHILVREMGGASTVLLRNKDNTLPLKSSTKSIALIGSDAGPNPWGFDSCVDQGCSNGTLAQGWGSGTAIYPYLITPLDGISSRAGKGVKVVSSLDDFDLTKAAETAKGADIAFVFSNADSGEEYIDVDGNIGDRKNMTLWHNGDNLITAVADANKNTVVVIHSVGAVLMPWINHPNIKAVVWPGLPGQESGNSLADVLFGDVNPSGRLPYTIAKEESDYPVPIDSDLEVDYTEKLEIGHRWFDQNNIEPLFEFGFGLSYTNFKYSGLSVKVSNKKTLKVEASLSVRNTGGVDGAEVVQAYIEFPESANEPPKILRGFEKVSIKKNKTSKVSFEFTKTELSIWDVDSQTWVVPSGKFTLHIGASSRDIRQTATFVL
ncbi:glycoside hydrolase family 3 protein [Phycomyces blakesleeanus]|uniref:Probable beta-glucosidase G n=2 Tax=Phycomyces blakesleeanus TaxID=4837 RepID=A0A167QG59_PHYB8|nr:glycoside hydrolase family 3 protein [Phycomyces blakesleeanus NRRL 1555(-)]OAD79648.1 glycoside hydrolase family 3 protein [Phycomyces blakesleeanus NRRL 1555(-)]|eukprot:XP_018297688.1 glycoside hydrolase family 3 protein [Phycomyces blakesleeanus NRRL 1555(-)]